LFLGISIVIKPSFEVVKEGRIFFYRKMGGNILAPTRASSNEI
jgi:hypothetical protein